LADEEAMCKRAADSQTFGHEPFSSQTINIAAS